MSSPSGAARHWDAVYNAAGADQVSWYQPEPAMSLELIDEVAPARTDPVIDVGGGASTLVDHLLRRGHTELTVLDASAHALDLAKRRLGADAERVHWVARDLLRWDPPRRYALWHDRAVFHFLTGPDERARYRQLAASAVNPGGHLIVATFAADGPERCSGLPVARYSDEQLVTELGEAFTRVDARRERHHTPSGSVQPFTWLLLRRDGAAPGR